MSCYNCPRACSAVSGPHTGARPMREQTSLLSVTVWAPQGGERRAGPGAAQERWPVRVHGTELGPGTRLSRASLSNLSKVVKI